jgi:hypothetical protein
MVDRPAGQEVAGGEPGLPGADDDRGYPVDGLISSRRASRRAAAQATSTVTFVGLVSAS